MRVSEFLLHGRANAIQGHKLVAALGLKDLRDLTQRVERERKGGMPICASVASGERGYYLADGPEELEQYIASLDRRIHNTGLTRRHLEDTWLRMTGQLKIGGC